MNAVPATQTHCDVCVIGSGAGAAPVAAELSAAGYDVLVLEKGDWYREADFRKDEMLPRRSVFQSQRQRERHTLQTPDGNGGWQSVSTDRFWGGNIVGGASNFMSGFFHRLKPVDFRLRSEFGAIAGANVVDWPISHDELEPYYARVERVIGVSGSVVAHPFLEPRSTASYPLPPTLEHPVAERFDRAARELGLHPLPLARAVLSRPYNGRGACEYSGYCGSYGCHSGAKGSARAALLDQAIGNGHLRLVSGAHASRINTDAQGNAVSVDYFDRSGRSHRVHARVVNVACYAIESSRLLLLSRGERHPQGIGNRYGQLGRNLHCCAGGTGHGVFDLGPLAGAEAERMKVRGPFFNRALQDWYVIDDPAAFPARVKGGTLDFVFDPPAPAAEANALKRDADGRLVWGSEYKQRLKSAFTQSRDFKFEVFCDWLPNDDCHVSLDPSDHDLHGMPVARVRAGYHPHDLKVARYLVGKGVQVMQQMGAQRAWGNAWSSPTPNLVAGGLRFGNDARSSALDRDCRVHGTGNVFVSDGSFMPNGGSVTPTFTIYANAFRVADAIRAQLSSTGAA
jgi:choline dehydrogenase-like flavoprotein